MLKYRYTELRSTIWIGLNRISAQLSSTLVCVYLIQLEIGTHTKVGAFCCDFGTLDSKLRQWHHNSNRQTNESETRDKQAIDLDGRQSFRSLCC